MTPLRANSESDARSLRGVPEYVWICRECGKRSYAKKDPIAHERRVRVWLPKHGSVRHYVWCGPFDRYVCTLDDSRPQRDASTMEHLGTRSKSSQIEDDDGWRNADPEYDGEVPF